MSSKLMMSKPTNTTYLDSGLTKADVVIQTENLGKLYEIFSKPEDRLKQMFLGRLGRRKWYSEHWALHDVNLTVRRGEAVGILGRNGAGKSTFLQLLTGIVQPTTGSISINGRVAALLELGAGFNPEFTGRENVYLSASLLGLSQKEIDTRFSQIAEFADIGKFLEQPVKFYSSGMYARLAFSVAAHVDADVLIIDEILSVGDLAFNQKCMRFIKQFKKEGTLLFVTHDTAAVANICDRAVWIDAGRVRAEGPAKEVAEHYLASIFGGKIKHKEKQENDASSSHPRARAYRDAREEVFERFLPKAQIEFFRFEEERAFGDRRAEITDVFLEDLNNASLIVTQGGKTVRLRVKALVKTWLDNVFVGFLVRDRLGQNLFGDNTFLSHYDDAITAEPDSRLEAEFRFDMPHLQPGDYSITVAISIGTQAEHEHLHWIHDALFFRVQASHATGCLFGVPMEKAELSLSIPEKNIDKSDG